MMKISKPILALVKRNTISTKKIALTAVEKVKTYLENISHENKTSTIKELLDDSVENIKSNVASTADYKELVDNLIETVNNNSNLFRYIKNYRGIHIRNNKTYPNYRFYDEREWRYVPALKDNRVKKWLNTDQFKEYRGLNKSKPFIENINLPFTSNDIKYLIVKSNKDIPKLIEAIKSTNDLTKNSN